MNEREREYAAMRRMMRMVCWPTEAFSKSVSAAVIRELTLRQKEAVYLYYVKQMPMRAAAEILGVDVSTVSRTLKRARVKLRRCLGAPPQREADADESGEDFQAMMTER